MTARARTPGAVALAAMLSLAAAPDLARAQSCWYSHCTAEHWCQTSHFFEQSMSGAWAFAPDDVWAVGGNGLVAHWDGHDWSPSRVPSCPGLRSVWGAGQDDVWAVGEGGTLAHWDGHAWTRSQAPVSDELRAIWGSNASDIWAVGARRAIVHWDGRGWSEVTLAGHSHGAGAHNTPSTSETSGFTSVWGTGSDDAWAVGGNGLLAHWDGRAWTTVASPARGAILRVWGTGRADVWAVADAPANGARRGARTMALHWDGHAWTTPRSAPALGVLYGAAGGGLWGATEAGDIVRWDGASWSPAAGGEWSNQLSTQGGSLQAVWGRANEIWALASDGTVLRSERGTWSAQWRELFDGLRRVWALGPSDAWAVGESEIVHWDGRHWSLRTPPGNFTARDVWAASTSDVWVVGEGPDGAAALRWDGSRWQNVATGACGAIESLAGVWGSGSSDVWAVGDRGAVLHWDGRALSRVESGTTSSLAGIAGSASSDVWAVGDGGAAIHWDGRAWSAVATGNANALTSVWARAADDAWAAGRAGTVLHWDGRRWSAVAVNTTEDVGSVWSPRAGEVWVVTEEVGTLWHASGGVFSRVSNQSFASLHGVRGGAGGDPTDVWAVGDNGTILRYRP